MPSISARCTCGQTFQAKESLAGKQVRCPKCGSPFMIPTNEELGRRSGDAADRSEPKDSQAASEPCPSCSAPLPKEKIVCVACGYSKRLGKKIKRKEMPKQKSREPEPNEAKKPKPRRKSVARAPSNFDWTPILAGSVMMLGAAIWFFVGLLAGYIFFYPPILFVFGLITLLKGLF